MATNNKYAPPSQYGDVECDCPWWEEFLIVNKPLELKERDIELAWELVLCRCITRAANTITFIEKALSAGVIEEARAYDKTAYRPNIQYTLTVEGRERFAKAGIK